MLLFAEMGDPGEASVKSWRHDERDECREDIRGENCGVELDLELGREVQARDKGLVLVI